MGFIRKNKKGNNRSLLFFLYNVSIRDNRIKKQSFSQIPRGSFYNRTYFKTSEIESKKSTYRLHIMCNESQILIILLSKENWFQF